MYVVLEAWQFVLEVDLEITFCLYVVVRGGIAGNIIKLNRSKPWCGRARQSKAHKVLTKLQSRIKEDLFVNLYYTIYLRTYIYSVCSSVSTKLSNFLLNLYKVNDLKRKEKVYSKICLLFHYYIVPFLFLLNRQHLFNH